jgi:hypothetical protein
MVRSPESAFWAMGCAGAFGVGAGFGNPGGGGGGPPPPPPLGGPLVGWGKRRHRAQARSCLDDLSRGSDGASLLGGFGSPRP